MGSLVRTALLLLALLPAGSAWADPGSLYHGPGPRPGPDLLYDRPAVAPELTNSGVWHAPPILVSGTSAYRQGEFLWQGWLFDDHGAEGHPLGSGTDNAGAFAWADGSYQYPTDPAYADDAADLIEFRVKPLSDATAFRLTFNSMKDPSLVGTTIALGGTPGQPVSWPYGAAVKAPAGLFLTVHGAQGDLRRADGSVVDAHLPVGIDLTRRQIEVDVPHADWDPGTSTVRMAGGVGLWDKANDRYLIPTFYSESQSAPAGSAFLTIAGRSSSCCSATSTPPTRRPGSPPPTRSPVPCPRPPTPSCTRAGGARARRPRRWPAATSAGSSPRSTSASWPRGSTTT